METKLNETLNTVFQEVTEQLAFMFAEPLAKEEIPPAEDEGIVASMTFRGALRGRLELVVPRPMCAEVAGNMLGADLEDMEQAIVKGTDALKEVLNVICGHILTALAGDGPVFELSIPDAAPCDLQMWENLLRRPETLAFLVDDHPVLLCFQVENAES